MRSAGFQALSLATLLTTALAPAQTQLTSGSGGGDRQPVVDPSGQVVIYGDIVSGSRELFTVPSAGGAPTQVTSGKDVYFGFGTFDRWPSLSISDNGLATYWNAAGVHLLDLTNGNDTVLATSNLIPYPRLSADGTSLVYQAPAGGSHEVFRSVNGGIPVQLTNSSGGGRRLPDVFGSQVLYQKPVGGQHEVFLHVIGGATTQLSLASGGGNRYARFSLDGNYVVYEAVTNGRKEVWGVDLAAGPGSRQQLSTSGGGGDRLAMQTADEQVVYQAVTGGALEVTMVDANGTNQVTLSSGSTGGIRAPSVDRHGHVVVYQAVVGGTLEVFSLRRCFEASFTAFGSHGTPSVGSFTNAHAWYRCDLELQLLTGYTTSPAGACIFSATRLTPGVPLPGAPGNFLWMTPHMSSGIVVDPQGKASLTLPLNGITAGRLFYQWALLDPAANALGVVTSEGIDLRS